MRLTEILPISQTLKPIIFGCVTVVGTIIIIGFIMQLKKARQLQIYAQYLILDGQQLSSNDLHRVHVRRGCQ